MQRVEGTLVSFIDKPLVRHGMALTEAGKEVFLPGASRRKQLNGTCEHYRDGEEKPAPQDGAPVVMDISPCGDMLIANNWAVKD